MATEAFIAASADSEDNWRHNKAMSVGQNKSEHRDQQQIGTSPILAGKRNRADDIGPTGIGASRPEGKTLGSGGEHGYGYPVGGHDNWDVGTGSDPRSWNGGRHNQREVSQIQHQQHNYGNYGLGHYGNDAAGTGYGENSHLGIGIHTGSGSYHGNGHSDSVDVDDYSQVKDEFEYGYQKRGQFNGHDRHTNNGYSGYFSDVSDKNNYLDAVTKYNHAYSNNNYNSYKDSDFQYVVNGERGVGSTNFRHNVNEAQNGDNNGTVGQDWKTKRGDYNISDKVHNSYDKIENSYDKTNYGDDEPKTGHDGIDSRDGYMETNYLEGHNSYHGTDYENGEKGVRNDDIYNSYDGIDSRDGYTETNYLEGHNRYHGTDYENGEKGVRNDDIYNSYDGESNNYHRGYGDTFRNRVWTSEEQQERRSHTRSYQRDLRVHKSWGDRYRNSTAKHQLNSDREWHGVPESEHHWNSHSNYGDAHGRYHGYGHGKHMPTGSRRNKYNGAHVWSSRYVSDIPDSHMYSFSIDNNQEPDVYSGRYHGNDDRGFIGGKLNYPDTNGCTRPGDVVCDAAAATQLTNCQFARCILASESVSLWGRPSLTVSRRACPANTGVLTRFCNQYTHILEAIGYTRGQHTEGERADADGGATWYENRSVFVKDPCILFRAECSGILDTAAAPIIAAPLVTGISDAALVVQTIEVQAREPPGSAVKSVVDKRQDFNSVEVTLSEQYDAATLLRALNRLMAMSRKKSSARW